MITRTEQNVNRPAVLPNSQKLERSRSEYRTLLDRESGYKKGAIKLSRFHPFSCFLTKADTEKFKHPFFKSSGKRYDELKKRVLRFAKERHAMDHVDELHQAALCKSLELFSDCRPSRLEKKVDQAMESVLGSHSKAKSRKDLTSISNPNNHVLDLERDEILDLFYNELNLIKLVRPRRLQACKMRYGVLPFKREHTFHEIGKEFKVSATQARDLVIRGLIDLQHPRLCRAFEPILNSFEGEPIDLSS